jgi:hypothetical protein
MTETKPPSRVEDTRPQRKTGLSRLVGGGIIALLLAGGGCVENLADCVEVYASTGANRLHGYSRIACEEHCRSITGWIDCYWDG